MIGKKARKTEMEEKILDVDASIQGNMIFKDPVNLKINGKFEGNLTTRGNLTVGANAEILADIIGENIIIAGQVTGDIIAERSLRLISPAKLVGNIRTPSLIIDEGAVLNGNCQMIFDEAEISRLQSANKKNFMSIEDVARYLEIEQALVTEWANSGQLRGKKENGSWRFDRASVEDWVRNGKLK